MRAVELALIVALVATSCGGGSDSEAARQAEVAQRGAQVMPFDLDATTHVFKKTDTGGVQTVTADDPGDTVQISLIREHLRHERENFSRGDFEDPARIHGHDMPGVAELSEGYARIEVSYADEPAGARLEYVTSDPALVDAIHAWFDRQLTDHGAHAQAG